MRGRPLLFVVVVGLAAGVAVVRAQDEPASGEAPEPEAPHDLDSFVLPVEPGAEGTPDELEAWSAFASGNHVRARELAEALVAGNPRSFLGHFVLGLAQHYGEANFPRALYHEKEALRLFEARFGDAPSPEMPWRWHARMLRELAITHGDLEHYAERLELTARYNLLYDPDVEAESAWPLMKMGRVEDARRVARRALGSTDPGEVEIALNSLCAIEFEAGRDGASYEACRRAVEHARRDGGTPTAVDLTNFAEAARSMFQLEESERILLEATRAEPTWFGNPWLELAELYTREARFAEALHALREIPAYRRRRPPHVQNADRNESWRALAAFFLALGRPEDALRITEQALVMPDRRAHNSRDPAQDRAIIALLDRRALRVEAAQLEERAAALPLHARAWSWARAAWLRARGWRSGRQARQLLADERRLEGIFRIGTAQSAVLPPWLAGELVELLGAGIVRTAVARARAGDDRPGAAAYYDAFAAEALLAAGDPERALEVGGRAVAALGPGEAMLGARVRAVMAEAARRSGDLESAGRHAADALSRDPGVFRRLDLPLAVRITGSTDGLSEELADALARSPRFVEDEGASLRVHVSAEGALARACLEGPGVVFGCGTATPESARDLAESVQRAVNAFHAEVFAPRIDLSQADANSLDGSNRVQRDPFDGLFDADAPPAAPDDAP